MDTGEILHQIEIPITDSTTATDLYQQVDSVHVTLMEKAVPDLLASRVSHVSRTFAATYWGGVSPRMVKLTWREVCLTPNA